MTVFELLLLTLRQVLVDDLEYPADREAQRGSQANAEPDEPQLAKVAALPQKGRDDPDDQ